MKNNLKINKKFNYIDYKKCISFKNDDNENFILKIKEKLQKEIEKWN